MTSYEVYQMGKKAKLDGNSLDKNPFEYGTKDYTYWFDGWMDA